MKFWIYFFLSLPWYLYFGLWMALCAVYFILIAPPIFYFFITPRIEKRYHKSLKVDGSGYVTFFPNYFIPPMEASFHIFCKYVGWEKLLLKNPRKSSIICKFKEIEYNVYTASKFEIIMSCISIFFLISLLVSGSIFAIMCEINNP